MDQINFDRLYKEVYPILVRVSFHITGDQAVAEEMCQEAFIRYLNRPLALPSEAEAKYWLIRVVKNLSLNHQKRRGREWRAYERFHHEPKRPSESGETALLKRESAESVKKILDQLPEKLKTVMVLREYGDLSYKEIGKVLKITEGNVKVRMFRARAMIQSLLPKEDVYVP